ncbi:MAG: PilZ domain-containing protein [Chitinispirillaceae bacterium]|nr:PilZ domain-containing protein [Chitinispirillaceae bacterium]
MVERGSERIEYLNPGDTKKKALLDVSSTGAAFIYPERKEPGSTLVVKIKERQLDAEVVYSQQRLEGFRIGVQFQNVAADMQEELEKIVDEFSRGVPIYCEITNNK